MSERFVGDLDLGTLRVLHLLLAESSVSRAAARLGRSQPAVSATLRRLREVLGDPLLVRSGGHLVLTERGHELKPLVARIVDDLDGLLQTGSGFAPATCCRPVRILAPNCFGAFFLPLIVERLRKAAPRMPLELCPSPADDALHRMLETGELDMVIGNWPAPPGDLRTASLLEDDIVCMVGAGHPLARASRIGLDDYLQLDHLSPTPASRAALSPIDGRLAQLRLPRRIAVTVPEYSLAPKLLAHSDLVFTTGRTFAEHLASHLPLALIEAPPELGRMRVYMLWHERSHHSALGRWLRALVRGVADEVRAIQRPGISLAA
jgi:DNA-binding transcriptional LysR family regulator